MTEAVGLVGTGGASTKEKAIPDVRLVRLCAEYVGKSAELTALCEPWYFCVDGPPGTLEPRIRDLVDHGHRIQAIIAACPAHSSEGLKAKARALVASLSPAEPLEDCRTTLARGLAADVLRILGGDASRVS